MKRISDCNQFQLRRVDGETVIERIFVEGVGPMSQPVRCKIVRADDEGGAEDALYTVVDDGDEYEVVFFAHPWYGLKDGKGWLTRYPNRRDNYGNPLLSRQWVEGFIAAGGSFDGCAVWGVDPNAAWLSVQSPSAIARILDLEHAKRFDNVRNEIFEICKQGLQVSEDIDWPAFAALGRGVFRMKTAEKAGIAHSKTAFQLGWMSAKKWDLFVAQNATRFPAKQRRSDTNEISWGQFFGVPLVASEYHTEEDGGWNGFDDSRVTNPVWRKAKADYLKYKQRREIFTAVSRTEKAQSLHSFRAMKWVLEKLPQQNYRHPANDLRNRISESYTSEGRIQYSGNLLMQDFRQIKSRGVGGSHIAKIGKTFFAWRSNDFQHHAEGATVREALEKLEKRTRVKGLKMSLLDIRENSSFCFAGVKDFLAKKMRHVYNLVANFSCWDDLPEEIATIEWELTSRRIFAGVPEP